MSWRQVLSWNLLPEHLYEFTGKLVVYREPLEETLKAKVILNNGKTLYYYRAPQKFINLVTAENNIAYITFIAEKDGRFPRKIKVLDRV